MKPIVRPKPGSALNRFFVMVNRRAKDRDLAHAVKGRNSKRSPKFGGLSGLSGFDIIYSGWSNKGGLTEFGNGEQMKVGMKTFAKGCSAWGPSLGMVVVSLFLGMTALVVSFGFASAFEVQGTNSIRETIAPCVATALYLAFCQFWVAPRGAGRFWARLSTLVAAVVPLLVFVKWTPRMHGIPWGLASGCLGSMIGAADCILAYNKFATRNSGGRLRQSRQLHSPLSLGRSHTIGCNGSGHPHR